MRMPKLFDKYSFIKRPMLKAVNPRIGTSLIPLDNSDSEIFLQYLSNKIHALHFEGSEGQLRKLIDNLSNEKKVSIQKIRTSVGRGGRLVLVHLKFPNESEIRRVIKLS